MVMLTVTQSPFALSDEHYFLEVRSRGVHDVTAGVVAGNIDESADGVRLSTLAFLPLDEEPEDIANRHGSMAVGIGRKKLVGTDHREWHDARTLVQTEVVTHDRAFPWA